MRKEELIKQVAESTGIAICEVRTVIEAALKETVNAVANGKTLEQLKTEQALIASRGLTREILYKQFIDKWDGKTPLYGIAPEFLKMTK